MMSLPPLLNGWLVKVFAKLRTLINDFLIGWSNYEEVR